MSTELIQILELPRLTELPQLMNHSELDGSSGTNRQQEKPCQIAAKNDFEAIQCWLNGYKHNENTFQSYQKEAERLLLWCILQAKKPLSSLTRDDFETYSLFLDDPQPTHIWCGRKGTKRGTEGWKPFQKGLTHRTKSTAITILNSMMNYLAQARYLDANPLALMRTIKRRQQTVDEQKLNIWTRILEDDEWKAILQTLDEMPIATRKQQDEKMRLKLIIGLLFFLGLRVGELTSHTWQSFKKIDGDWWFFVRGKGNKLGKIPMNDSLLEIIIDYRVHFDMTVYPHDDELTPLIWSFKNRQAIDTRRVHQLLKELAIKAAEKFPDNLSKQKKLYKFSPHWLRHLSATMQDRAGIEFKHVRENLRHASDDTTRLYVHAIDKERHEAMKKLVF